MKQCKICGGKKTKKIGELCSNMRIMGTSFNEGKCNIVSCEECGFVYNQYEDADQKNFDDYYLSNNSKTVNYYDIFDDNIADEYFEHIFKEIKEYIHPDSKIIDIAGGYGEFCAFLAAQGYTNVTLLEMKAECVEYARSRGIEVKECNLFEVSSQSEKYDMVICSHDLEHFVDLDKAIEKIRILTKDNGKIFIEVPNISLYSELDRAPFHFLTYEHVCHFSEITIKNLATRWGLQMESLNTYVKCNDYPCIYGVFGLRDAAAKTAIVKDEISSKAMSIYINKCQKEIAQIIDKYEKNQKALILWGIGASTAQLLNNNFDKCNVIQLVDVNPSRQGITFAVGNRVLTVEPPEKVTCEDATIFILPTAYKGSIIESIRRLGFKNEIDCLK